MKQVNLIRDGFGNTLPSFVCSKGNVNLTGVIACDDEDIVVFAASDDVSIEITWSDDSTETITMSKNLTLSFNHVKSINVTGSIHLMR